MGTRRPGALAATWVCVSQSLAEEFGAGCPSLLPDGKALGRSLLPGGVDRLEGTRAAPARRGGEEVAVTGWAGCHSLQDRAAPQDSGSAGRSGRAAGTKHGVSTAGQLGGSDRRPRAAGSGPVQPCRDEEGPDPVSCLTSWPSPGRGATLPGGWCPGLAAGAVCASRVLSSSTQATLPSLPRPVGSPSWRPPLAPHTSLELTPGVREPVRGLSQGSATGSMPAQRAPAPSSRTGSGNPAPSPVCPHAIQNLPGSLDPETPPAEQRAEEQGMGTPHLQGPRQGAGLPVVHLVLADLKCARLWRGLAMQMQHRGWVGPAPPMGAGRWLPRCSGQGPTPGPLPKTGLDPAGRGGS